MKNSTGSMADWFKQVLVITGLLLMLPGIFLAFGFVCITLILTVENNANVIKIGLIGASVVALTAGTGGTIFWHSIASLKGKRSKQVHFPSIRWMVGVFILYVGLGVILFQNKVLAGLFLPITVLVATATPPVFMTWWFMGRSISGVTWRRGIVAFAGSAVICTVLAIVLQILLLIALSFLDSSPVNALFANLDQIKSVAGDDLAHITINRDSLFILFELGIVIPIIATLTKPLVVLPLTGYLSQRELFFIGALAGAGFATLESIVFVLLWPQYWALILIVQVTGGAVHPLGAGMLTLKWQDIFNHVPESWTNWAAGFGLSTTVHALWNTGLLFVLLNVTNLFLALLVGGLVFLLLLILGLIVIWSGHSIAQQLCTGIQDDKDRKIWRIFSEHAIAVWAVTIVTFAIPIGLITLQVLTS